MLALGADGKVESACQEKATVSTLNCIKEREEKIGSDNAL